MGRPLRVTILWNDLLLGQRGVDIPLDRDLFTLRPIEHSEEAR